ncbi:MAG: ABC transporter substrate-binding protein [Candidatus Bathyarchaeia archaeon]
MKKNVTCYKQIVILLAILICFFTSPAKQLIVAVGEEPATLDPAIDYTFGTLPIFYNVYEKLVEYDPNTNVIIPALAISWETSEDGLQYIFRLREGVQFHDGSEFDAYAVKFAYDRVMTLNVGPAWMLVDYVKNIDVLDKFIVAFTLYKPFAPFVKLLASSWGMWIPSPFAIQQHDVGDFAQGWLRTHAVGTGPYKLVAWVERQQFILERFENYWKGWSDALHHLDKIVLVLIPDPASRVLLLEAGAVDVAYNVPLAEVNRLKLNPNIRVEVHSTFVTQMIAMNTTRPLLNNKLVRQAISYAFDYTSALAAFEGYAPRLAGVLPEGMFGALSLAYEYNIEKAVELLEQAGVTLNGLQFEFTWVTEEPEGRHLGLVLQSALRKLGADLLITEVTVASHWDRIMDPETTPDFACYRWCPDFPDPLSILIPLYHGDYFPPKGYNIARHSIYEVNEALAAAEIERDESVRLEWIWKVQHRLLEEASNLWVCTVPIAVAMRANVYGYKFNALAFAAFNFYDMYKL